VNLDKGRARTAGVRLLMSWLLALALLAACNGPIPRSPTPEQPPLAEELLFYDWIEDMPQSVLDAFGAEYGVRVVYLTYEAQEEVVEEMRAGAVYDVVVLDNRFLPALIGDGLLAEIDYRNVPNFRNISANFRDMACDPSNTHSVPYNWGTTGLVVRSDLVEEPVTRWADLWDPRYAGKVALWRGERRELIGLALKALGYSANSENPAELEAALQHLLELRPRVVFLEDLEAYTAVPFLLSGEIIIAEGWSYDALEGREAHEAITYVLPAEGALLWGDSFVIPANSPNRYTAEVFLNFLLRPGIGAQIVHHNLYATANEAARSFIAREVLNDPLVFPPNADLVNAEVIQPLSPAGEQLYAGIWERFEAAAGP